MSRLFKLPRLAAALLLPVSPRRRRGAVADAARAGRDADADRQRLCARQRHRDVLRRLWRRRSGAADPWRARPCRYLGEPGGDHVEDPQGDRRRQPRPRPLDPQCRPVRLRSDGVRLSGAARLPEDRQDGAGRLERRRHHRHRYRAQPSRAADQALRPGRQRHRRRPRSRRHDQQDFRRLHRALGPRLQEAVEDA